MTTSREAERAFKGALKILRWSLALRSGETLTIFYDETGRVAADVLIEAASSQGLVVHGQFVSEGDQASFGRPGGFRLSTGNLEAISAARAILACLSDSTECTTFRRGLIRAGTDRRRRLGHIPGARLDVLFASADSDDKQIEKRCDDLCLALSLTNRARLATLLSSGRAVHLDLELGGVNRPSIQSTGRIPINTWGNIPGGESFIAPVEGTAEGGFVLNGSMNGMVLHEGCELVLVFRQGRIVELDGHIEAKTHFEEFLSHATKREDANWNRLAELGVGVNDGITQLSGSSLIDEKCAGTAHIAIGDNTRFGGSISSCIHEDLITRSPSLWLDDRPVLDRGRWTLNPAEWREPLEQVESLELSPGTIVRRGSLITAVRRENTLRARRKIVAGRSSSYTVAAGCEADILFRIYKLIPDINSSIRFDRLAAKARERKISPEALGSALAILVRHGMIEITPFDRR